MPAVTFFVPIFPDCRTINPPKSCDQFTGSLPSEILEIVMLAAELLPSMTSFSFYTMALQEAFALPIYVY